MTDSRDPREQRGQRDERIALLADVLRSGEAPVPLVRIRFERLDPSAASPSVGLAGGGIEEVGITVHDLPAGRLRLDVYAVLGPIASGRPAGITANDKGWPVAAGDERTAEIRALGWVVDPTARRTWEVDPSDTESLGEVVDEIAAVIDISTRIAGVLDADHTTWTFHRAPAPPPTDIPVPRDEPWREEASEPDLRALIVQLAGLRGGRILVRSPRIAIAQLELTAWRWGDRISVRGSDDLSPWRGRWTVDAGDAYVGGILEELRAALARHEPGAPGPTPVSLRIERHDEAAGWAEASAYVMVFSWAAALAIAALGGAVLGHPAVTVWLDEATRLASDQGAGIALLVAVAITTMIPVFMAWYVGDWICGRILVGYAVSAWVDFVVATVTGVAYITLLANTGDRTLLVIVATWAVGLAAAVGPGLVRRLRGGARRA